MPSPQNFNYILILLPYLLQHLKVLHMVLSNGSYLENIGDVKKDVKKKKNVFLSIMTIHTNLTKLLVSEMIVMLITNTSFQSLSYITSKKATTIFQDLNHNQQFK